MKRTSSQLKQLARESLAHRFSLPVMAYVITFGIIMLVNMLLAALFPDTGNSISYLVISFITDLLLSILSVGPVTILLDMSRGSDGQLSDLLYAFRHQPDRIIVSYYLTLVHGDLSAGYSCIYAVIHFLYCLWYYDRKSADLCRRDRQRCDPPGFCTGNSALY